MSRIRIVAKWDPFKTIIYIYNSDVAARGESLCNRDFTEEGTHTSQSRGWAQINLIAIIHAVSFLFFFGN